METQTLIFSNEQANVSAPTFTWFDWIKKDECID